MADQDPKASLAPRQNRWLTVVVALLALGLAAVGWVAWDARQRAAKLASDLEETEQQLASAEERVRAEFEASIREATGALGGVAARLEDAEELADRVDEMEHALWGFTGVPFLESNAIGSLEQCVAEIARYLDARQSVFFCDHL